MRPGQPDGFHNRLIEDAVTALGGHKSLYSTVHYPAEEFWRRYNGTAYGAPVQAVGPQPPRLGAMLHTALQEGMPPSKIRAIIHAQDSTRTQETDL